MQNVRLLYEKTGRLRFVSHLDMNRFMIRMLRLSGLPIWYTEGFHPHPYVTFALPLSLGFESRYEVMDFRLTQEVDPASALASLNRVFPPEVRGFDLFAPEKKPGEIAFAQFEIRFCAPAGWEQTLDAFLRRPELIAEKKTKKGETVRLNLAPKLHSVSVAREDADVLLRLTLPAGGTDNLNPTLLLSLCEQETGAPLPPYTVCRTLLLDRAGQPFR